MEPPSPLISLMGSWVGVFSILCPLWGRTVRGMTLMCLSCTVNHKHRQARPEDFQKKQLNVLDL